jgi:Zn-dependent M28 family amino/carboxypeptidase
MFQLASLAFIVILFARGVYLLAIGWPNFASLLELSPRMTGVWNWVWWVYMAVFTPRTLLITCSLIPYFTAKFSYGADDNASGISVMIETARRLQGRRLKFRIDFACFAAEEKGLYGSRKWVNKHLSELDKDRTNVLNIDCVGRGERFFVCKGLGTIFKKYSDPMLCCLLAEACSELKLPLEERWGGGSDHAEFVEKKFRTCAIARFNCAKAGVARLILRRMFRIPLKKNIIGLGEWIHTENDTLEGIDEQKLEESVELILRFVEKLNQKFE